MDMDRIDEIVKSIPLHFDDFCIKQALITLWDELKEENRKWYTIKSNFPLLCYVREENRSSNHVTIVTGFSDGLFKTYNLDWEKATPLSKDEVLEYCLYE